MQIGKMEVRCAIQIPDGKVYMYMLHGDLMEIKGTNLWLEVIDCCRAFRFLLLLVIMPKHETKSRYM